MERINYAPPMTKHLMKMRLFENDAFSLVDVGASGGIEQHWNIFSPCLKAIGFEPLVAECNRLNADRQKLSTISYEPYFVTGEDPTVRAQSGPRYAGKVFERSSAALAAKRQSYDSQSYYQNGEAQVILTDQKTSLDHFFATKEMPTIDFIKIDTDGHDYEVLHGAQKILQDKQVLGISVEAQLHGDCLPYSNTFRNIDKFLAEAGFSLFNLEVYRYTKKDLPGNFCYSIPAQTLTGQALWGEALYLRDYVANTQHPSGVKCDLRPTKILKLAAIFEIFGLHDSAAELFIAYRDQLTSLVDVEQCLNLLVQNTGRQCTYSEHVQLFNQDIAQFYPATNPIKAALQKSFKLKELLIRLCKKTKMFKNG